MHLSVRSPRGGGGGGGGVYNKFNTQNESDIACKFADIIYFSFLKPLISKPTRVTSNTATLVYNILTND